MSRLRFHGAEPCNASSKPRYSSDDAVAATPANSLASAASIADTTRRATSATQARRPAWRDSSSYVPLSSEEFGGAAGAGRADDSAGFGISGLTTMDNVSHQKYVLAAPTI